MSLFTSLGIILLSMLIGATLQLSPGVFAIFYHQALGKTTAKKADDRSLSFVLGIEIFIATTFLITYLIISYLTIENNLKNTVLMWVMAGFLLALAVFSFFCYYHNGKKSKKTTRLFLPRLLASGLTLRAKSAKNRSDTIMLGLATAAAELFFTLPLYIVSSIAILNISPRTGFLFIIAYIIIATLPLFAIRTVFRTGHNLAEIQRSRVKNKPFVRIILSISYLLVAILTFIQGVI